LNDDNVDLSAQIFPRTVKNRLLDPSEFCTLDFVGGISPISNPLGFSDYWRQSGDFRHQQQLKTIRLAAISTIIGSASARAPWWSLGARKLDWFRDVLVRDLPRRLAGLQVQNTVIALEHPSGKDRRGGMC
jgi:hypothetical protein